MIISILFYILLCLIGSQNTLTRERKILYVCMLTALYAGIRWDYTPDYPAYQYLFEQFSDNSFHYDENIVHVEYGWYLINKYLSPIGYYGFVFLTSCIFAFGVYKLMILFTPDEYVWIVILGVVTAGGFTTLLSAQRQMLVASIVMISYRYLLYNHVSHWRDLYSKWCILYYLTIIICTYFHKSAFFMIIVPLVFAFPAKSKKLPLLIITIVLLLTLFGSTFLVGVFQEYSSELGMYDYLNYEKTWAGTVTVVQGAMWCFIIYYSLKVYFNCEIDKNQQASLMLGIMAILVTLSGYYLSQVGRIAHYMYVFTYMNIGIIYVALKEAKMNTQTFTTAMIVWIVWNALKIFSIRVGTFQEYKTIFSAFL